MCGWVRVCVCKNELFRCVALQKKTFFAFSFHKILSFCFQCLTYIYKCLQHKQCYGFFFFFFFSYPDMLLNDHVKKKSFPTHQVLLMSGDGFEKMELCPYLVYWQHPHSLIRAQLFETNNVIS